MAEDDSSARDELKVPEPQPEGTSGPASGRHRSLRWFSAGIIGVGLVAAGYIGWTQVKPTIESRKYRNVTKEVPAAPQLSATSDQQLLRIDPVRSSLQYEIGERFAGKKASTAKGATKGIAGDIVLDRSDLAKSKVGTIVANVEQFESDNNLRDARIRKDFLESHAYPLATFDTTELTGLSGPLKAGESRSFAMVGNLTVKKTTTRATWQVKAQWDGDKLTATATTTAKLSRFDAGPISIAGLVTTDDEIKLVLKLTAVDPATNQIATTTDAKERAAKTEGAPSFAKEVKPILASNCASCHNTGQMAADSVRLDTAGDAAAISDGIKTVTETGYMPPWPASDKGVELDHVAKLTKAELATLAAWSDAGGPLDVEPTTKVTMTGEQAALKPRQDKTVRIPAYLGSTENRNDYRCFVLDPKITEPTVMSGYTFVSDDIRQVHHMQLFQISAAQRESARAVEGKDGRSGWQCYAGPSLDGQRPSRRDFGGAPRDIGFAGQSDLVGGWVPGQSPVVFPGDSGIFMQPGDALVIQIHFYFAKDPVPDTSGLALQLDTDVTAKKKLRIVNPLGPVELPCSPNQSGPLCDRDAALAENVKLYGPSGASNEAGLLALCGKTPELLVKNFDGYVGHTDCNLKVPQDGEIVGVAGHMHTIGKSLRLTLDPDTPKQQILLDIPDWSFDWQMAYALKKPLRVKAGQDIRLECAWDRRKAPGREPKYIVFAEGTEDEMCFATYSLIPDHQN